MRLEQKHPDGLLSDCSYAVVASRLSCGWVIVVHGLCHGWVKAELWPG